MVVRPEAPPPRRLRIAIDVHSSLHGGQSFACRAMSKRRGFKSETAIENPAERRSHSLTMRRRPCRFVAILMSSIRRFHGGNFTLCLPDLVLLMSVRSQRRLHKPSRLDTAATPRCRETGFGQRIVSGTQRALLATRRAD
jgi:hypothetical protein